MTLPGEQPSIDEVMAGVEAEARRFVIVQLSRRRWAIGERTCNVGTLEITDNGKRYDIHNWQSVKLITEPLTHGEALAALRRAHDGEGVWSGDGSD